MQILENNTEFEKDNFEILPYIIETVSGSTISNAISSEYEQLIPIPFEKTVFQEDGVEITNILQTPDFINHFFDVLVDEEIPEELPYQDLKRLTIFLTMITTATKHTRNYNQLIYINLILSMMI